MVNGKIVDFDGYVLFLPLNVPYTIGACGLEFRSDDFHGSGSRFLSASPELSFFPHSPPFCESLPISANQNTARRIAPPISPSTTGATTKTITTAKMIPPAMVIMIFSLSAGNPAHSFAGASSKARIKATRQPVPTGSVGASLWPALTITDEYCKQHFVDIRLDPFAQSPQQRFHAARPGIRLRSCRNITSPSAMV